MLAQAPSDGCSRPRDLSEEDVRVEMLVTPEPPAVGTASIGILLRDAEGQPLDATGVKLEANMSHAGMKPTFADARRTGRGRWHADLDLTMGGDWFVLVQARLEDGRRIERTFPLPQVGAP